MQSENKNGAARLKRAPLYHVRLIVLMKYRTDFLVNQNTIRDTKTPFNRLNGATANTTKVSRPLIWAFTAVPMPIKASIGSSKALE